MATPNAALKMAIFGRTTQTVLARRARIDESRLSRIINGHTEATSPEKKRIARALRMTVVELFGADTSPDGDDDHDREAVAS